MSSEGHILGREGTLSIRGLPHLSHAASGTPPPPTFLFMTLTSQAQCFMVFFPHS